jgi:hypothetical protein
MKQTYIRYVFYMYTMYSKLIFMLQTNISEEALITFTLHRCEYSHNKRFKVGFCIYVRRTQRKKTAVFPERYYVQGICWFSQIFRSSVMQYMLF